MKKLIKKIPVIGHFAKWVNFIIFSNPELPAHWIDKYIKNSASDIIQIGSNDGITSDPVFHIVMKKTKLKVLLVEPVPYLFEELQKNYGNNKRFKFENAAINNGFKQTFYYVRKEANMKLENLPDWYNQLGSFYKENIIKHLDGILEPFIEEMEIQGLTFNQLFKKNNIENVSLLHIDTEGYDWKILSQLDLKKYKPLIILFEYKHLSESEKQDAIRFLDINYFIFVFNGDYLCIRKDKFIKRDLGILGKRKVIPVVIS